jgi:hypothetical protein
MGRGEQFWLNLGKFGNMASSYFATLPRNHLAKVELPPPLGKPIIVSRSTVISLI